MLYTQKTFSTADCAISLFTIASFPFLHSVKPENVLNSYGLWGKRLQRWHWGTCYTVWNVEV